MNGSRRRVLKGTGGMAVMGLAVSAGLFKPGSAWAQGAWNKAAFEAKSVADTVKAMGGRGATESRDIVIHAPDIAENGASVNFMIASRLAQTEAIALLVEKNPNALVAQFVIPAGTEAAITTRAKMAQSSNVTALVKAGGRYYYATREVRVTLGGCG